MIHTGCFVSIASAIKYLDPIGPAKGVLKKIKNERDETIGYLFGTIHAIAIELKESGKPYLHPKILKYLSRCHTLFTEVEQYSERKLEEEIKKNLTLMICGLNKTPMDHDFYIECMQSIGENPGNVEDILASYAFSQGVRFGFLETPKSRYEASKPFEQEAEDLERKIRFIHMSLLCTVTKGIDNSFAQCAANISERNSLIALHQIAEKIPLLLLSYSLRGGKEKIYTQAVVLKTQLMIQALGCVSTVAIELAENILEILDIYIKYYDAFDERAMKQRLIGWIKGEITVPTNRNDYEKKMISLKFNIARLRAFDIAEIVHRNLLQSSKELRHFYTVGADHLADVSGSLKNILEMKGWKIVDAYQESSI